MAKRYLHLNIPEPCDKKFAHMTPTQGGRFCDSCEKVIVDFSKMTDAQIAKSFMENKGKICGQFKATQLNRKIDLAPTPPSNFYRGKAASILLSGLLTAGVSQAQNIIPYPQVVENQPITVCNGVQKVPASKNNNTPTGSKTFKTVVTDETGETLIGASIILKSNHHIGTITDIDGLAELEIPEEYLEEGKAAIEISYTGYVTIEVQLDEKDLNRTVLHEMNLHAGIVVGGMVAIGYYSNNTLFDVVKNFIRKQIDKRAERKARKAQRKLAQEEFVKSNEKELETKREATIIPLPQNDASFKINNVFPNPFSNEINLELTADKKGDVVISIFEIGGRKIYQVTQRVEMGQQDIYLSLKNVKLGNSEYVLQVRDEDGKVETRKLVRGSGF